MTQALCLYELLSPVSTVELFPFSSVSSPVFFSLAQSNFPRTSGGPQKLPVTVTVTVTVQVQF